MIIADFQKKCRIFEEKLQKRLDKQYEAVYNPLHEGDTVRKERADIGFKPIKIEYNSYVR